ncbi:MAG: response regulator transcription factor [Acidobacteriota bacterium]
MKSEAVAKISVFVADDHPVFRRGLREIIEEDTGLAVVGEAPDGQAALEQIRALRPDVAVLDIEMPNRDGFALAREMRDLGLEIGIIFLTMYREESLFNRALDIGVKGYLLKDSAAADIVASIRAVAAGKHYISPELSSYLVSRMSRAALLDEAKPGLHLLTPMERRILKLISEQKTSKEIAAELFISSHTVNNHRNNICRKLDLHGSNALLRFAIEHRSEL